MSTAYHCPVSELFLQDGARLCREGDLEFCWEEGPQPTWRAEQEGMSEGAATGGGTGTAAAWAAAGRMPGMPSSRAEDVHPSSALALQHLEVSAFLKALHCLE